MPVLPHVAVGAVVAEADALEVGDALPVVAVVRAEPDGSARVMLSVLAEDLQDLIVSLAAAPKTLFDALDRARGAPRRPRRVLRGRRADHLRRPRRRRPPNSSQ